MSVTSSLDPQHPYLSQIHYNANGQVTSQYLGNGVTTTNTYNNLNGRLTSSLSGVFRRTPCSDLSHNYDNVAWYNSSQAFPVHRLH